MTCLLDVNALMALLWENHEHHSKVRAWFKGVPDFATCPVSQLGFARVSSHPLLGYGMTPDEAFGVLRRLLADSRHRFVADDLSCTPNTRNKQWSVFGVRREAKHNRQQALVGRFRVVRVFRG